MEIVLIIGILIAVVLASGLSAGGLTDVAGGGTGGGSAAGATDNTPPPQGSLRPAMPVTNDPTTWPFGDVIWNVCRAIAIAEGADVAGSNPDRLNNPGDISDGYNVYGGESHSGSNITRFPSKEIGWQWLYSKVHNIAVARSNVYSPYDSWVQIAQKWAGNWQPWVNNVTTELGVNPNSQFNDYTGMA